VVLFKIKFNLSVPLYNVRITIIMVNVHIGFHGGKDTLFLAIANISSRKR
jgi:hypothetical protein